MKKGIQKYGIPRRIYFDNGSQYRTHWMKRAEIDRIPVDSSRLLDAVARTAEERERRAVISYTQARPARSAA